MGITPCSGWSRCAMHLAVGSVPKEEIVAPRLLEAALARDGAPTAADLAERIGVDVGTMSRWRRGVVPLSRARWLAIVAVLGLPIDWKPPRGGPLKKKRGRGRPRKQG